MTKNEIYAKALDKWGVKLQHIKAIEELSELIQEIAKIVIILDTDEFITQNTLAAFFEEFADVEIMLEQIRLFKLNGKTLDHWIDKAKEEKLARLAKKVGDLDD